MDKNFDSAQTSTALHREPPGVLCVICGEGIASLAELDTTHPDPAHLGCRPAN